MLALIIVISLKRTWQLRIFLRTTSQNFLWRQTIRHTIYEVNVLKQNYFKTSFSFLNKFKPQRKEVLKQLLRQKVLPLRLVPSNFELKNILVNGGIERLLLTWEAPVDMRGSCWHRTFKFSSNSSLFFQVPFSEFSPNCFSQLFNTIDAITAFFRANFIFPKFIAYSL